jgi:hypothetical protein
MPEWMKSEEAKTEMLKRIRREVKDASTSRRELGRVRAAKFADAGSGGQIVISFDKEAQCSAAESSSIVQLSHSPSSKGSSKNHISSRQAIDRVSTFNGAASLNFLYDDQDDTALFDIYAQGATFEADFITKYLDYVFPFLFPFYKPAIFETGRSWLLSLLRHSKIALHSTLSLTAFFFTIALDDAYGSSYGDCRNQIWRRLSGEAHKCFEDMQHKVRAMLKHDVASTALEKVHMMDSIIQMIVFELIVGGSSGWTLHLTASIDLFEQIFNAQTCERSKMLSAILSLGPPVWYKMENDSYIWSPDQAGFRFSVALLVVIDIIASTAVCRQPRLAKHHTDVLGDDDGAPVLGFTRVRLSSIMGCQNCVIAAIGDIASLNARTKAEDEEDKITDEILEQVSKIGYRLELIRSSLPSTLPSSSSENTLGLAFQPFAARATARSPSTLTTKIWACAAQIFLTTVEGAEKSSSSTIVENVSQILELVHHVEAKHWRTLSWPLCVAGCFASLEQQTCFRTMFAAKSELEKIGSIGEAWRVMESVWAARLEDENSFTDLTSCLNIFGRPLLLI